MNENQRFAKIRCSSGVKVNTAKHRTHSLFRQDCMLYELIPNMPVARLRPLVARFHDYLNQHEAFNQTFAIV